MTSLLLAGSIGIGLDKLFFGFDMAIFTFFGNIQSGFLTFLAKLFTSLGGTPYVMLLGLLALVLFCFKRTRRLGLAVFLSIIIGTLLVNIIVKPMVLRIRPYNTLQNYGQFFEWYLGAGALSESDYCFPSGHTNGAFEIATALVLYTTRCEERKKRKWAWFFVIAAVLVMVSRVYLMVHYASDVIFGMLFGIVAGILGYALSGPICKWINRRKIDYSFDLGRLFKNKVKRFAPLGIFIGWLIAFVVSVVIVFGSGGDAERCAYEGEYKCYNESKEKYEINGEYYCKIHYKELTQQK
ncbi:MAG: phosphatase PAP2 family protein [Lachnospiraceae bacterium]|nr:phosphatase PAP2 family protein [Lachnospiraceae bacterium]MBR6349486.1 phosphatase PAP2 family protein [Lachnospiraceae bacterium]